MTDVAPTLLYRAADVTQAAHLIQALETAGIPLAHTDAMSAIGVGDLPTDALQVDIWVPAGFAEQGRQVIEEHQARAKEARDDAVEWSCASCGEDNASSFDVCWSCKAPREGE